MNNNTECAEIEDSRIFLSRQLQFFFFLIVLVSKMSTDLKCSPREASDCPIFRLHHRGHVHVTAACRVDNVDDLWLPLSCDLRIQQQQKRSQQSIDLFHSRRFVLS